jgi:uncharacterized metal-binding protein YceD (DUF177 family)
MKQFTIPFVGLKEGKHHFSFEITKTFFDYFGYDEFNDAAVKVVMILNLKSTMIELEFEAQGSINVNCDLTSELFDQPIEADLNLIVQFGEEFNDENEEILILPHGEYEVNVQQYIYEMIVLAKPSKLIHPGIEDGTLDSEVLSRIEEFKIIKNTEEVNEDIDPRWNKLKNLLTDK